MADNKDIFGEDWLECMRAHYMHVVRNNDKVTLPSLTVVMGQAGFNETELAELRVRATMHVDKVAEDFVPDLDVLEPKVVQGVEIKQEVPAVSELPPQVAEEAPILETSELPQDVLIDESPLDDEVEEGSDAESVVEGVVEELPEDDPDAPQQLSLF